MLQIWIIDLKLFIIVITSLQVRSKMIHLSPGKKCFLLSVEKFD